MHMSKNNIFKENFQRYIDGFYSKNELESILKQIKNYCTDEDIDQLTEQLWSNLGDETLANRFEKATCENALLIAFRVVGADDLQARQVLTRDAV